MWPSESSQIFLPNSSLCFTFSTELQSSLASAISQTPIAYPYTYECLYVLCTDHTYIRHSERVGQSSIQFLSRMREEKRHETDCTHFVTSTTTSRNETNFNQFPQRRRIGVVCCVLCISAIIFLPRNEKNVNRKGNLKETIDVRINDGRYEWVERDYITYSRQSETSTRDRLSYLYLFLSFVLSPVTDPTGQQRRGTLVDRVFRRIKRAIKFNITPTCKPTNARWHGKGIIRNVSIIIDRILLLPIIKRLNKTHETSDDDERRRKRDGVLDQQNIIDK